MHHPYVFELVLDQSSAVHGDGPVDVMVIETRRAGCPPTSMPLLMDQVPAVAVPLLPLHLLQPPRLMVVEELVLVLPAAIGDFV